MNKKLLSILLIFIFIFLIFSPIITGVNELTSNYKKLIANDNGWVYEVDNVTILHLKGSPYEMGYQHGTLLKEKCLQFYRAFIYNAETHDVSYVDLLEKWNKTKKYRPQSDLDEMQGIADALNLSFEYVAVAHMATGNIKANQLPFYIECGNFACWGSATADGKLYQGRSYDLPIWKKDPLTGIYVIQENQIVMIREPDDGYASISISLSGYVGAIGGMNENGIVIGQGKSKSSDEVDIGASTGSKIKQVLDHATNSEEAITYITSNGTYGLVFIISDCRVPESKIIETSANYTYVGTWNSPEESLYPFWQIENVTRRANLYINQTLASTQRSRYNPKGSVLWLIGKNQYFPYWRHYKDMSIELEKNWGKLDSTSLMNVFKNVYSGKTDFLFYFGTLLHIIETWHQWIICPETGDMWFTLAGDGKSAFKREVHHVNMYDYIQ